MISVIIPTFNRASSILRSVNSVLEQTYTDIEVLVVDDGSTDQTEWIMEKIRDPRIRYIKQKKQGACAARNNGIKNAKGEYIAFQDSDDLWHQDKLDKQMDEIKRLNADVCFCMYEKYFSNGESEGICGPDFYKSGLQKNLKTVFGIGTQTLIGKAEVFREEMFDSKLPRWQDLELLVRINQRGYKICFLDMPLVDYYRGSDTIGGNYISLYIAGNRLLKIHPELRSQYPKMCKSLAGLIFRTAGQINGKERLKMGILGLRYHADLIDIAKFILLEVNLYKYLEVFIEKQRNK